MGDWSEPSGTGTRFGRVVVTFAGVAALLATLITFVYEDLKTMSPLRVLANSWQTQFNMASGKELPQASPPEIRRPNLDYGPDILDSIVDESPFPQSRVLGRPIP